MGCACHTGLALGGHLPAFHSSGGSQTPEHPITSVQKKKKREREQTKTCAHCSYLVGGNCLKGEKMGSLWRRTRRTVQQSGAPRGHHAVSMWHYIFMRIGNSGELEMAPVALQEALKGWEALPSHWLPELLEARLPVSSRLVACVVKGADLCW